MSLSPLKHYLQFIGIFKIHVLLNTVYSREADIAKRETDLMGLHNVNLLYVLRYSVLTNALPASL